MVKFIINNLGGSILRTIGRIIAIAIVGVVLYFIAKHYTPTPQTIQSIIRGALV